MCREELPKTLEGFVDPKWKGRIGLEATDSEWMAIMIKQWGPERGNGFFQKLSTMKPDVRKEHILLSELVTAGEIEVSLTSYRANAESMKRRGGPIDWMPIKPVMAHPQGIALAKNVQHPLGAMLFPDFVLSPPAQKLFHVMGRVPTSLKIKSNLNNFPYVMIDPVTVPDESKKWEALWHKLFLKNGLHSALA